MPPALQLLKDAFLLDEALKPPQGGFDVFTVSNSYSYHSEAILQHYSMITPIDLRRLIASGRSNMAFLTLLFWGSIE